MNVQILNRLFLVAAICLALMAGAAKADVINFDDLSDPNGYGVVPTDYGSTSLVSVSYYSTADITSIYAYAGEPDLWWWPAYGDLNMVAYSANPHGTMLISFTPVAGYAVTLNGFDLGQYGDTSMGVPAHYDVIPFYIADTAGPGLVFPSTQTTENIHSHFAPNYTTSGTLTLAVASNWNVGIDNIDFSLTRLPASPTPPAQSVPEPTSMVLLASGAMALVLRRRK